MQTIPSSMIVEVSGDELRRDLKSCSGKIRSYARKLVTAISGGVFDLLDAVLEFHSLDELGELA